MEIGTKVYYEKVNGNVVQVIGQRSGEVIETTVEQDFESYTTLASRVPETIGMFQLEYDAYQDDYSAGGYITSIDLDKMEPLFTYPDFVSPGTPEPRPALSKQVDELSQGNVELRQAVSELSLVLATFMGGGE